MNGGWARNTLRAALLLLAAGLLLVLPRAADAADVRLGHPVYDFLERHELHGFFEQPLHGNLPYSRLEVAKLLIPLERQRDRMHPVDRRRLDRFLLAFRDDLRRAGFADSLDYRPAWAGVADHPLLRRAGLYTNGRDAASYGGGDWALFMNPSAAPEVHGESAATIGGDAGRVRIVMYGFHARGWWRGFSVEGVATDAQVNGDPASFDTLRFPTRERATSRTGRAFDHYDTRSSISYEHENVLVHFGKSENRWGHARSGSLVLSGLSPASTQLRLAFRFGPFNFTTVQAKLVQFPRIVTSVDTLDNGGVRYQYADKWMAAHRLEWRLMERLQLGLFEQVIYGERGLDPDYLAPVLFFRGAEHYTGDRDNLLIGFDFRGRPVDGLELHAQVLLDELSFSELGSESFRNKHALLAGLTWADPAGLPSSLLHLDYAVIRPFVYTHKFAVNTAQQYGVNLGYPMPPNSDRWSLGLQVHPHEALGLELRASHLRHGDNPPGDNVGGDVREGAAAVTIRRAPFLAGDLRRETRIGVGVRVIPVYDLELLLELEHAWRSLDPVVGPAVDDTNVLWRVGFAWHPVE